MKDSIVRTEDKMYSRGDILNSIINCIIANYYPNPSPDGCDHDKVRDHIIEWFNKTYPT